MHATDMVSWIMVIVLVSYGGSQKCKTSFYTRQETLSRAQKLGIRDQHREVYGTRFGKALASNSNYELLLTHALDMDESMNLNEIATSHRRGLKSVSNLLVAFLT